MRLNLQQTNSILSGNTFGTVTLEKCDIEDGNAAPFSGNACTEVTISYDEDSCLDLLLQVKGAAVPIGGRRWPGCGLAIANF